MTSVEPGPWAMGWIPLPGFPLELLALVLPSISFLSSSSPSAQAHIQPYVPYRRVKPSEQKSTGLYENQKKRGRYFICDYCGYETWKRDELCHHMKWHGKDVYGETLSCANGCGYIAWNKRDLKGHESRCYGGQIEAANKAKKHWCTKCGRGFSTARALTHHVRTIHTNRARRYVCKRCDKVFVSDRGLRRHWPACKGREQPIEPLKNQVSDFFGPFVAWDDSCVVPSDPSIFHLAEEEIIKVLAALMPSCTKTANSLICNATANPYGYPCVWVLGGPQLVHRLVALMRFGHAKMRIKGTHVSHISHNKRDLKYLEIESSEINISRIICDKVGHCLIPSLHRPACRDTGRQVEQLVVEGQIINLDTLISPRNNETQLEDKKKESLVIDLTID